MWALRNNNDENSKKFAEARGEVLLREGGEVLLSYRYANPEKGVMGSRCVLEEIS